MWLIKKAEFLQMNNKLKLHGFNNLTKTLSLNIYDVCYASTEEEKNMYKSYINKKYSASVLSKILCDVTNVIDAQVLSVSKQEYEPQGASVNILIAEEIIKKDKINKETLIAHLDKSHLTVHTYPESHPQNDICTFRIDIDVSTCGKISPLKALNHLIEVFKGDIFILDYKIRGFTRDVYGNKLYKDHEIKSIQQYIDEKYKNKYNFLDINNEGINTYHTKMIINNVDLQNYYLNHIICNLNNECKKNVEEKIIKEMKQIYNDFA
jgi:S-adenosylmethionine decarboxylase